MDLTFPDILIILTYIVIDNCFSHNISIPSAVLKGLIFFQHIIKCGQYQSMYNKVCCLRFAKDHLNTLQMHLGK